MAIGSGVIDKVQPPSCTKWWCFEHNGNKFARLVTPPRCHGTTWWMSQSAKPTWQWGWPQVRVHDPQRSALGGGGDPSRPSVLEGDAVAVQHHGDEVAVAGDAADRFDRYRLAGGGLGDGAVMDAVGQGGLVDQHHHFGHQPGNLLARWPDDQSTSTSALS